MNSNKISELKTLFTEFKTSQAFADREAQKPVTVIFREILAEALKKNPITNQDYTDLIQIFKFNCSNDNFDAKLEALVVDKTKREDLSKRAYELEQPGYTNAGKTGVTGLNQTQLDHVKSFLLNAYNTKTIQDAVKLCRDFESLNVPQIKKGVFSIWLHYINPEIFPIVNNSHNNFKNWIDLPDEYSDSIEPYHEIKKILNEKDFGEIDFFAHHFTPDGKLKYRRYLDLNNKSLYKVSHGSFAKQSRFTEVNLIETLEKNNWVSISSYTGKGAGSAFEKDIKIGDIVYVCYGGDTVHCVGEIISEAKLFPMDIAKSIGDDEEQEWLYREIKPLFWPIDKNISDLKSNRSQTMPSGNSTFWQIKPSDFEMLNEELFIPKFNLEVSKDLSQHTSQIAISDNSNTSLSMALNTIMYGPPGTGKTYNTVEKALNLLGVETGALSRTVVKQRFSELQNQKRLFFTTFHQSMSYEDFIEGIKPMEPDDDKFLKYEIQDGLFMKACIEATYNFIISNYPNDNQGAQILTYNQLFDQLFAEIEQEGEREISTRNGGNVLVSVTGQGNFAVRHENGDRYYTVSRERLAPIFEAFPDPDTIGNIHDEFRNLIGGCNATAYWSVLNVMAQMRENNNAAPAPANINELPFEDKKNVVRSFWKNTNHLNLEEDRSQPYVFIIDEINRGNVAQIFGELITLIEDDKRLSMPEMIKLDLLYSKLKFCVPPNLYIIGTMNTADRSVEALDTALRRRFAFEEKMPNPNLLTRSVSGISLQSLLSKINERIELLLDRDHTIGHSYFINVTDESELKQAFKNKILPLLQEYFYGDYGKIGLVLGAGFVAETKPKNTSFAKFNYPGNEQFIQPKYELLTIDEKFKIVDAVKALLN